VVQKKLIAIDLDGTLFYPKKPRGMVSKQNIAFVRDAFDFGHKIVFVTSRNHQFVNKVIDVIQRPIDVVSRNGTTIFHQGQFIQELFMDAAHTQAVVDYVLQKYPRMMLSIDTNEESNLIFSTGETWWLNRIYNIYYFLQGQYRESYRIDNDAFLKEIKKGKVQRLLIYFGLSKKSKSKAHSESELLAQRFPDLEVSWIQSLIEVASHQVNKAEALKKVVALEGIEDEDVIVVGDSGNDIPLFKSFTQSYCMRHAHPRVKQFARYQLDRVYHLRKVLSL
jgi:Cof subfamily protein (haloacid dehalogenase superfamily)